MASYNYIAGFVLSSISIFQHVSHGSFPYRLLSRCTKSDNWYICHSSQDKTSRGLLVEKVHRTNYKGDGRAESSNYHYSSSESVVKLIVPAWDEPSSSADELLLSKVRSMTTGGLRGLATGGAQMWLLKTLRVMNKPQPHLTMSLRNSDSRSPGRSQESSLNSRSSVVSGPLAGRSYTGT